MQSWIVEHPAPIDEGPLRRIERPEPEPGPGQIRVRVSCCGVCRTDLHLAEGDLVPKRAGVALGHEVVGRVDALGAGVTRFALGDRVGVPWLASTDGTCRFCRRGQENLCLAPRFTGWDSTAVTPTTAWPTRVRLPVARLPGRRARRAAAVRRHHRLPRAAVRGRPARRPAGHLRLRRQRSPHRTDRAAPRFARTRADPRRAQSALARELGVDSVGGAADRRPNRWTARSCSHPPASWCRSRCAPWTAGGTLAVAGIWLSDIPALQLRRRAVPGAPAAQRHREHPQRRRAVPAAWPAVSRSGPRPSPTRWRRPRRPWPTSLTAGSAAPPCCTIDGVCGPIRSRTLTSVEPLRLDAI